MILTVFRSRLKPESTAEYAQWALKMSQLASKMPGYVSHKVFVAQDGERVTIVEFESEQAHKAWATHPEHIKAQKRGREAFYSHFSLKICEVLRTSEFSGSEV